MFSTGQQQTQILNKLRTALHADPRRKFASQSHHQIKLANHWPSRHQSALPARPGQWMMDGARQQNQKQITTA
jgi:hypothetical protein